MKQYAQGRWIRLLLAITLGIVVMAGTVWLFTPSATLSAASVYLPLGYSYKTVSPGLVGPGETVTYTIVLSNSSAVSDVNALLNDPLPTGLTYVVGSARTQPAASGHLTPTAHAVAWSGVVASGQVISLSFKAKVDASLSQDVALTNTATLSQINGTLTLTAPLQIDAQLPSALIWSPQAGQVVTAEHLQVMGYAWDGDERPSFPADPVLAAIQNNGFGYYNVTWSQADLAISYVLQEADNAAFSASQDRYAGPNTQVFVQAQPAGVYYYRVMAINLHGNSRWSNVVSVTVNTLAMLERERWDGNSQLQQANSSLSGVWVQIDNSPWLPASGLSPWTYSFQLSQQDYTRHTLQAYSRDEVGHTSLTDTIAFYVDRQAPAVTLSNLQAGQIISSASVQIQGTVGAEAGPGQVQVALSMDDGQTWQAVSLNGTTWSYPWTPGAADGVVTITTRSIDGSGNVQVSDGLTVTVDRQSPLAQIENLTAGQGISLSTYLITGTASDQTTGVAWVELSINAGGWQTASGQSDWSYPWAPGTDGAYTLCVRAVDGAGNVGASDEVTATVDRSKPQVAIVSPAANAWISATQYTITGTASDNLAVTRVEVRVNTGDWQAASGQTTWSYPWTPGANGDYRLWARAVDQVGNITQTAGITVGVDSTPPQVSIVSLKPNQQVNVNSTVAITGTASDGQSGLAQVEVSTDGGTTWKVASGTTVWSYNWKASPPGTKPIRARALDAAGNLTISEPVTVTVKSFKVYLPLVTKTYPAIPAKPTLSLIPNDDYNGDYMVTWSLAERAIGYDVQEATNEGFTTGVADYNTGNTTYLQVTGKICTGKLYCLYYYRVRARNSYGTGAWSNVQSVSVYAEPVVPTLNAINNTTNNDAYTVSWGDQVTAEYYELQEATSSDFVSAKTVYTGSALSYAASGKAEGTYYYRVKSVNRRASSAWSNVVSTTVSKSFRDDFNDPSNGKDWVIWRYDDPSPKVEYKDGRMYTLEEGSYDFAVASPRAMVKAPGVPYVIKTRVKIVDEEVFDGMEYWPKDGETYGIVFGGNHESPCPADREVAKGQGCMSHYYRLLVVWSANSSDSFVWNLKRIEYHDPEDGGKGRGDELASGIATGVKANGWNEWKIEVTKDNITVLVNDKEICDVDEDDYVNEPYFGVFMASTQYGGVGFQWDWFEVKRQ